MSKELSKTKPTEVSTFTDSDLMEWGTSDFSSKDLVIPKLILTQVNSELVAQNKAKNNEFLCSVTKKSFGNTIENLIPVHMDKMWRVEKLVGKKYEFERYEKMTLQNENNPYEFEEDGAKYRNVYQYRFFFLIPGEVLPYACDFKSTTGRQAGKDLATEMYVKNAMKRLPPAAFKITLSTEQVKTEDGANLNCKRIKVGDKASHEQINEALNWFKTIRTSDNVVISNQDEEAPF